MSWRRRSTWATWIALKMVPGIGDVFGRNLVRVFGEPGAVFAAAPERLRAAGLRNELAEAIARFDGWDEAEEQASRTRALGGRLVTWPDDAYPARLRHVHDAPLFLFVLGELTPADELAVAVVGSRSASRYGLRMAAALSEGLSRYGITVASGLARGIDAAAHHAALAAGGRTVAVLGNGIDVIYPSEHHRLFMQIANNGAVLSEFPVGTRPEPENFPRRNRIISGLSLGTVVVEATERSGSLITARAALEQGREVFAVPGPVGAASRGPHRLIRQGAVLVESAEEIVAEIAPQLGMVRPAPPRPRVDGQAAQVFGCLGEEGANVDEVIARTGLEAPRVLELLLELELAGLVRQSAGNRFEREVVGAGSAGAE